MHFLTCSVSTTCIGHIAKKLAHHIRTYPAANAVMAPARSRGPRVIRCDLVRQRNRQRGCGVMSTGVRRWLCCICRARPELQDLMNALKDQHRVVEQRCHFTMKLVIIFVVKPICVIRKCLDGKRDAICHGLEAVIKDVRKGHILSRECQLGARLDGLLGKQQCFHEYERMCQPAPQLEKAVQIARTTDEL